MCGDRHLSPALRRPWRSAARGPAIGVQRGRAALERRARAAGIREESKMPGPARKDIVREGEIGTYHCWSRCVQRAFLCGYDPVTERDFDYRRGWIEDLLA